MNHVEEWADVPGYPTYQVSESGKVRRIWRRGYSSVRKPLTLKTQKRLGNDCVRVEKDGKRYYVPVKRMVALAFFGGVPKGKCIYHRNGIHSEHSRDNIAFGTRSEIGKKFGKNGSRKPVVKIAPDGGELEFYTSAVAAGKDNFVSPTYVRNRCKGKVKYEFRDGFSFRYDE